MNCNVVGDFSINCKISFIQNKINHFQLVRSYSYYEWQLLRKINIGPALLETKLENAKSNNSLVSTAISFHCYSLWWGICSILVSLFSCKYIMHTVYTHAKKFSRKKHSGNIQTFLQIVRIPNDYFRLRNMDKHLDNKFEFLSLKSVFFIWNGLQNLWNYENLPNPKLFRSFPFCHQKEANCLYNRP